VRHRTEHVAAPGPPHGNEGKAGSGSFGTREQVSMWSVL
jgi:hypothetical protein